MAKEISIDDVFVPSEDVVARLIEGEMILVPIAAGVGDAEDALFTLNETGKAIWELLDGVRSLRQVVAELSREFAAIPAVIEADVKGLVQELVTRRMLARK